jgi:hypothetical protein
MAPAVLQVLTTLHLSQPDTSLGTSRSVLRVGIDTATSLSHAFSLPEFLAAPMFVSHTRKESGDCEDVYTLRSFLVCSTQHHFYCHELMGSVTKSMTWVTIGSSDLFATG